MRFTHSTCQKSEDKQYLLFGPRDGQILVQQMREPKVGQVRWSEGFEQSRRLRSGLGEEQVRAETKSLSAAGESKRQAARWTDNHRHYWALDKDPKTFKIFWCSAKKTGTIHFRVSQLIINSVVYRLNLRERDYSHTSSSKDLVRRHYKTTNEQTCLWLMQCQYLIYILIYILSIKTNIITT